MNEHLHIHKKTGFQTASKPQHSSFQSRPFVVQAQTEEQSKQPDIKTALQRAERYGHRLDRIKSIKPPVQAKSNHRETGIIQRVAATPSAKVASDQAVQNIDSSIGGSQLYLDGVNGRLDEQDIILQRRKEMLLMLWATSMDVVSAKQKIQVLNHNRAALW